jgi:hypothetical protein
VTSGDRPTHERLRATRGNAPRIGGFEVDPVAWGIGIAGFAVLEPTILLRLLVGLGAALLFFLVLGALLDPWLTRRMEHQER